MASRSNAFQRDVEGDATTYAIAVLALTAIVYGFSLMNGFVAEDYTVPPVFALHMSPRSLAYFGWVSVPSVMHLSSVFVHLAVVALVGVVCIQLNCSPVPAMIIAGLHPMASQATLYAIARTDLLGAAGLLVLTVAVLNRNLGWAAVGFMLTFLTKESDVPLAGVLLLVTVARARWRLGVKVISIVLAAGVCYWLSAGLIRTVIALTRDGDTHTAAVPFIYWMARQCVQVGQLIGLTIVPFGLAAIHELPLVSPVVSASILLVVSSVLVGLFCEKTRWITAAIIILLAPRFIVRTTLEPLTEAHWYPVICGIAIAVSRFTTRFGGVNGRRTSYAV